MAGNISQRRKPRQRSYSAEEANFDSPAPKDVRTESCKIEYPNNISEATLGSFYDIDKVKPQHLQTCVGMLSGKAILCMYSNKRFYGTHAIEIKKEGNYQEQVFYLKELSIQPQLWMPILTSFEYYKYNKNERVAWRKAMAKRLLNKLKCPRQYILEELNKLKPFPQTIRNVYDNDFEEDE